MENNKRGKALSILLILTVVLGIMAMIPNITYADEIEEQGTIQKLVNKLINSTDDSETVESMFKLLGNLEGLYFTDVTTDEGNKFISLSFKKVDIMVDETPKLEGIVYDKTEKKLIPIYSPKNNFEEAIYTDFKHKADFLMVVNRYPVSVDEAYCVFVETYGNTCVNFNGLRHDKSPFKEYGFIWMYLNRDFVSGTRYDVLKERWGIDDNYIKYKLEPNRRFGMTNQEWMDWSYTYFR